MNSPVRARWTQLVVVAVLVGFAAWSAGPWVNNLAHKGRLGSAATTIAQLVVPKPDLYEPLVSVPLNLSANSDTVLEFNHRYAGTHEFEIVTETLPSVIDLDTLDYSLRIDCASVGGTSWTGSAVGAGSPFWGSQSHGFVVLTYEVPDELPLEQIVRCEVHSLASAQLFRGTYGATQMVVGKGPSE